MIRALKMLPLAALAGSLWSHSAWATEAAHGSGSQLGTALPLWSCLPFAGILLSIALFPLVRPHFWHKHYPKIAAAWAVILVVPFLWIFRGNALASILHTYLLEYLPFIILLWALFTVAGGVVVRGKIPGTPGANVLMLLIGTLIASWVGTTGASMLLIHPLLRANANRQHKAHTVIFFIFLVSNIGGALTPLGDPPLFLGFLSGVPFFWTLRLLPHLGVLAAYLLLMYWLVERRYYQQEIRELRGEQLVEGDAEPVRIVGLRNLPLLLAIVFAVLLSGIFAWGEVAIAGVHIPRQNLARDVVLLAIGLISLRITPHALRAANQFSWEPIREVAILFAGIFMTIIPALAILNAGSEGALGFLIRALKHPWQYFWFTGGLSAFLDNAPTYLTFFNSALGKFYGGMPKSESVPLLLQQHAQLLEAVSAGAVFLGAMTYIGNAPNFMVRSMAEERGVAMPSFFGYLARWSLLFLVPGLVLVTLLFFR